MQVNLSILRGGTLAVTLIKLETPAHVTHCRQACASKYSSTSVAHMLFFSVRVCRGAGGEAEHNVCRVEIVDWDGQVLRSFGLNECEGAPHDARIVRRSSLVGALRSAIPPHLIRYGVSVADVHTHEQGIGLSCSAAGSCSARTLHDHVLLYQGHAEGKCMLAGQVQKVPFRVAYCTSPYTYVYQVVPVRCLDSRHWCCCAIRVTCSLCGDTCA